MDVSTDNNINDLATRLNQYYNAGTTDYARYEIRDKKSLLMVDPALKAVFYVDRHGRPLLDVEKDVLLANLPANVEIVDISRLASDKNADNRGGYHANQPIYNDSEWWDYATQKIQDQRTIKAQEKAPELKEPIVERFQTKQTPITQFFTSFRRRSSVSGKENAAPNANNTLPESSEAGFKKPRQQ